MIWGKVQNSANSGANRSGGKLVALTRLGAEKLVELSGDTLELFCVRWRFALDRYVGPLGSEVLVQRQPLLEPRLGVGLDRIHRAFRFTDAAVDAFFGMDDEHVLAFIEAVDRTDFDAIHELALDA